MSRQFVNRVISLHYEPETIKFKTTEHADAFFMALGRMAWYQMSSDRPRELEIVSGGIDQNLEITCAYYHPIDISQMSIRPATHRKLEAAFHDMQTGKPFVMGAVPRDEGLRYTFHS